jgi:hypothetical protein
MGSLFGCDGVKLVSLLIELNAIDQAELARPRAKQLFLVRIKHENCQLGHTFL